MKKEKVIIWGAGEFGNNVVKCYIPSMISTEILAIVDKDRNKWGMQMYNIPIIGYHDINSLEYDKILICSPKYADEIDTFLRIECRIPPEKIEIVEDGAYFIYKRVDEKYRQIDIAEIADAKKREVVQYAKIHGARMFCYDFPEKYMYNRHEISFDDSEQMKYLKHDGKRLYLPDKLPNEKIMRQYYNSLCMEQDVQSPHLYQSDRVHVKDGDILLDVGAAEGFFALSVIDKISYAYLVEADTEWERALKATFRPYMDKVEIIPKFASDINGENEITIDSIIKNGRIDFIKMDIEGAEKKALAGAVNSLESNNVRCSVCTYHNEEDFDEIKRFFQDKGYEFEASDGFLLCGGMWEKDNLEVDFRKGIIRIWKE